MSVLSRNQMAWRAAQDLPDGGVVNLGLGMPVLVSNYMPADRDIFLQSENGILGVGPEAEDGYEDRNLVDAGSRRITLRPGASIVDSASSFAMIRGGHIDVTILGAFEVAVNGDLANWDSRVPDKGPLVGGAMDLAAGAKSTWTLMQYNTRDGAPRLLQTCSLPLTAPGCVKRVYTDIAVVEVRAEGFVATEIIPTISAEDLRARTGASITVADDCRPLAAPTIED
ncbi:MAG: 3-oxoacid CoA-transferase subunit B [Proteobacteria bacterium]|nr:3-oxoacid CoA-transferase subunit B [Pseudomonadota bacterium]MDA1308874.1 3-oxoacid CoA-transferase subunit B [Pseudomonadota bacterium]